MDVNKKNFTPYAIGGGAAAVIFAIAAIFSVKAIVSDIHMNADANMTVISAGIAGETDGTPKQTETSEANAGTESTGDAHAPGFFPSGDKSGESDISQSENLSSADLSDSDEKNDSNGDETKQFDAENGVYQIKKGDTLSGISSKTGVCVDELAEYNQIKDVNMIYADSALAVPKKN